jgi:hypothetical protein
MATTFSQEIDTDLASEIFGHTLVGRGVHQAGIDAAARAQEIGGH